MAFNINFNYIEVHRLITAKYYLCIIYDFNRFLRLRSQDFKHFQSIFVCHF